VLTGGGVLTFELGAPGQATPFLEEARARYDALGDEHGVATVVATP
jgi:hypothetical protein